MDNLEAITQLSDVAYERIDSCLTKAAEERRNHHPAAAALCYNEAARIASALQTLSYCLEHRYYTKGRS